MADRDERGETAQRRIYMKKTAIVTGGGRGIGYAIVRALGRDGMNIVLMGTGPEERYENALLELTKEGISWHYVQGSIASDEDRNRLCAECLEVYGRADVLVNNAGVAPLERKDLLEMTEESFDRVIGINTKGTLFLTQMIARQMLTQEKLFPSRGHIVNVGSCSAEVSSPNRGEYCISKAGVHMLTLLFADRLAGEGIFVNEVRPGVIATDMTSTVREKYDRLIGEGAFPVSRWGKPEDVAQMVAFYASDKVLYTTGSFVDVDGGFHIRRL